jgi:hypothetical protein
VTCLCERVGDGKKNSQYTGHFDDHCCMGYCKRCDRRILRAQEWAAFKVELAALLKAEEGCQHCRKGRRRNDLGKVHHPRQCWAHMEQRQMLALFDEPC